MARKEGAEWSCYFVWIQRSYLHRARYLICIVSNDQRQRGENDVQVIIDVGLATNWSTESKKSNQWDLHHKTKRKPAQLQPSTGTICAGLIHLLRCSCTNCTGRVSLLHLLSGDRTRDGQCYREESGDKTRDGQYPQQCRLIIPSDSQAAGRAVPGGQRGRQWPVSGVSHSGHHHTPHRQCQIQPYIHLAPYTLHPVPYITTPRHQHSTTSLSLSLLLICQRWQPPVRSQLEGWSDMRGRGQQVRGEDNW